MLDKSRADWKDLKQGDEALEEELEMHKRSADQVRRRAGRRADRPAVVAVPAPLPTSTPLPRCFHPPLITPTHPPTPSTQPPQYLDKQAFLKEAELREYERERDRRLASDVRNRGRL